MWKTWVRSLGREDPPEKEMATHSSTLAWRIPWREEPGGLQSMASQRVGHDWALSLHSPIMATVNNLRGFPGGSAVKASAWNVGDPGSIPGSGRFTRGRKWQPTPILLPGESHGRLQSMGSQRVGHDWETSLTLRILFIQKSLFYSSGKWEEYFSSSENKSTCKNVKTHIEWINQVTKECYCYC